MVVLYFTESVSSRDGREAYDQKKNLEQSIMLSITFPVRFLRFFLWREEAESAPKEEDIIYFGYAQVKVMVPFAGPSGYRQEPGGGGKYSGKLSGKI